MLRHHTRTVHLSFKENSYLRKELNETKMNKTIALILLLSCQSLFGQTAKNIYRNAADSTANCYQIVLPDSAEIKGLIVRDYSSLPDLNSNIKYPYQWKDLALKNGLAVLYTVTSNHPAELFYNDEGPVILDSIINEVISEYNIPKENLFIGGISASGTRALRFAQFCAQEKSNFELKIRGVFSVDSPLDIERFYYSAFTHIGNFKAGMLEEAEFVIKEFPKRLGCSPFENSEKYRNASVFSYRDSLGGNAQYYKEISMIFFHEPDIDWWVNERGASYFDINSFDISGFVNQMKTFGNKDVELITTTNKGYDRFGNRKCHSWTIVNEVYLIDWILERIQDSPNKE